MTKKITDEELKQAASPFDVMNEKMHPHATAMSPSDVELVVSKNVSSSGEVTKVSGGVGYTSDYYVMMPDMKK